MEQVIEVTQEKDTKTQRQKVLEWLQSGKQLTPLDALIHFECFNLAARVHELRNTYLINSKKANGNGYAIYWLEA